MQQAIINYIRERDLETLTALINTGITTEDFLQYIGQINLYNNKVGLETDYAGQVSLLIINDMWSVIQNEELKHYIDALYDPTNHKSLIVEPHILARIYRKYLLDMNEKVTRFELLIHYGYTNSIFLSMLKTQRNIVKYLEEGYIGCLLPEDWELFFNIMVEQPKHKIRNYLISQTNLEELFTNKGLDDILERVYQSQNIDNTN